MTENELLQTQITELKRVEKALRESLALLSKKNRYETIISTVTQSVHKSINLQDVLENAVETMSKNIDGVDNVSIYLVEGEDLGELSRAEAHLRAYRGYPDWFVERLRRIPYPKGFTWRTIIDGKPRYCADVDQDTVIGPAGREMGTKSYASMPIGYGGKTAGTLNINSLKKSAFDEEELKLLEIVAKQIEVAINNAQIAEALRQSDERYRTLFDQSPVGVYIFDKEFKITQCNERFIRILRSSYDKIIGTDMRTLKNQCVLPLMEKVFKGESADYEGFYEATKSPTKLWVSIRLSPLRDASGNVIGGMAVVEDITERKRTEEALRKSEERYRALYENNPLMSFTVDTEGTIFSVNQFGAEQLGYSAEELVGQSVLNIFYEEDKKAVIEQMTMCLQDPTKVYKLEFRKVRRDGRILWVKELARSMHDTKGNPVILIACEDITKQIEIQKELIQKEKLASLGEMAAGVAHEIRNPLGGIKMGFNLIRRNLSQNNLYMLDNILSGIKHIENIINELLDFTRESTIKKADYDISQIILNVVSSLNHEITEKKIELVYKRFELNSRLNVDGLKIRQVFANILKNAIEREFDEKVKEP